MDENLIVRQLQSLNSIIAVLEELNRNTSDTGYVNGIDPFRYKVELLNRTPTGYLGEVITLMSEYIFKKCPPKTVLEELLDELKGQRVILRKDLKKCLDT